jgi:hypothetical protein
MRLGVRFLVGEVLQHQIRSGSRIEAAEQFTQQAWQRRFKVAILSGVRADLARLKRSGFPAEVKGMIEQLTVCECGVEGSDELISIHGDPLLGRPS